MGRATPFANSAASSTNSKERLVPTTFSLGALLGFGVSQFPPNTPCCCWGGDSGDAIDDLLSRLLASTSLLLTGLNTAAWSAAPRLALL